MRGRFPWAYVFLAAVVGVIVFRIWTHWPVTQAPGVLAPDPPKQQAIVNGKPFECKGHTLTPAATFALKSRVLSVKRYPFVEGSDLSSIDLAMGWGRMSDSAVLKTIKIKQSRRFYFWKTPKFPIPKREIEVSSANMHMIPATPAIFEILKTVRKGHVVKLSGKLVNAKAANGRTWKTSMARTDTGPGACEIIWVESFEILP